MADEKTLGYLGHSFQLKVLSQILHDKEFADNIIPILNPQYFDDNYCRFIVKLLNDYHLRYKTSPSYDVLDNLIRLEVKAENQRKPALDTLATIKEQELTDGEWTQEKSFNFCKQQELKKAIQKISAILDKGDFEKYDEIEEIIKVPLSYGIDRDAAVDVFHDLANVMGEDYRETIPTGIEGFDELFKGGIAKGEICVILAPMGVGKTTMLTKISNSAFNYGANVLQIFFEDNIREIQRKHVCAWTGVPLPEMNEETSKNATVKKTLHDRNSQTNKLLLQRWPSDTITITQIKSYIRKLKSDGISIDMVIIDYIDCVAAEHATDEVYNDEGKIMRKFEAMCHELNLAGVCATQGNRSSISSDVVTNDQMGGSIKKGQIGHIVISIAKTLQQKESGLATMALLKSRISKDGIVFENCIFDNAKMEISTEQSETFLGFENIKSERKVKRAAELYQNRRVAVTPRNVPNNNQPNAQQQPIAENNGNNN